MLAVTLTRVIMALIALGSVCSRIFWTSTIAAIRGIEMGNVFGFIESNTYVIRLFYYLFEFVINPYPTKV